MSGIQDISRRSVRKLLGSRSLAYRTLSLSAELVSAALSGDLRLWRTLRTQGLGSEAVETTVQPKSLAKPIIVRLGTDDVGALINNTIRHEYGQLPKHLTPQTIVDAGAYIGDTSAYFLTKYPRARVVALEPNPASIGLARRNLQPYGSRAVLEESALWSSDGQLCFGGEQTGARAEEHGQVVVRATSIPSLMHRYNLLTIDLLKCDIEGAEVEVFNRGSDAWLSKVGAIILETHGLSTEKATLPVITSGGFRIRRFRNLWYCVRP